MDEEKAREIAIRIRDEFEDMLDEKNIMIPSADREGVPGEARLYGKENSRLEEAIVGLLLEQPDVQMADQDAGDASHPLRELAIRICEEFEELLDENGVTIPSADREGREEEARLYVSEYYAIEDAIVEILMDELAAEHGALAAVGRMQRTMGAAPEGLARLGPAKVLSRKASVRPEPRCGTSAPPR